MLIKFTPFPNQSIPCSPDVLFPANFRCIPFKTHWFCLVLLLCLWVSDHLLEQTSCNITSARGELHESVFLSWWNFGECTLCWSSECNHSWCEFCVQDSCFYRTKIISKWNKWLELFLIKFIIFYFQLSESVRNVVPIIR